MGLAGQVRGTVHIRAYLAGAVQPRTQMPTGPPGAMCLSLGAVWSPLDPPAVCRGEPPRQAGLERQEEPARQTLEQGHTGKETCPGLLRVAG